MDTQKLPYPLKGLKLDHIAIAVESIEKGKSVYEALGIQFAPETEVVPSQSVETAFGRVDENAKIELLAPYGDSGPIHKFLEKKGPGIHHLCFKVEDVVSESVRLRDQGLVLLYESPVPGAGNCLVNFIHPKSSGGVLIEISQTN